MDDKDKERQPTKMQLETKASKATRCEGKSEASLPVELQGAIGKQLKHVYGQMLSEPLPDKFSKLLAELGKTDKT